MSLQRSRLLPQQADCRSREAGDERLQGGELNASSFSKQEGIITIYSLLLANAHQTSYLQALSNSRVQRAIAGKERF